MGLLLRKRKSLITKFIPFNDYLLSLKGGANLESEVASETEKGSKSEKIKPQNP